MSELRPSLRTRRAALNAPITDWRSHRVWLIGASSGIGAALAVRLARAGARLALSARSAAGLSEVADACRGDGPSRPHCLPLDVTVDGALEQAHSTLVSDWGGIDLVIYCAGSYEPTRAWEMDAHANARTVAVNLTGALETVRVCVDQLLRQAGSGAAAGLCLVGSVAGYGGLPRAVPYAPTKAAVIHLAQCLYLDLAPRGVSVYLVSPGFVDTRLTRKNDFRMPALIGPDEAANEIVEGLAQGSFEIHFPKRFSRLLKCLGWLPHGLYFRLLARVAQ